MKIIIAVAALFAAGTLYVNAEHKVTFNELPEPVKQAIKAKRGDAAIKEIQHKTRDGQDVYDVEFNETGINPKLCFAKDGTLVSDDNTRPEGRTSRTNWTGRMASMKLSDVPEAVRNTIQTEAKGRAVADIDKETWNRQAVYEVEFEQTGRNAQIHVAENGTIVKDERSTKGLKGMFMGTQLEDTPAAVQAAIKRESGNREIADIDKETRTGQTLYEVEFKQPGRNIELHIAEDGTVVRDSRRDVSGQGTAPGEPQRDAGRGTANELRLNDVPAAVQQAIKAAGNPGTLKPIERKIDNGRTVYHVQFAEDGINRRMEIAEDGTVLKDNKR